MARRSKGEGTICRRKDGLWMAQATIGINPETGKPRRKTFYGKTRREVAEKLNTILHEIQQGSYIEPSQVTVEQWLSDWLEGRKPHIEESTWSAYEVMARCHITPSLGKVKLKDLRTRDLQMLLNNKLAEGLSSRTVKYIYTTINMALKQAVKERLIPYNPAEGVELPKQEKKEMKTLTREEVAKFLQVAKESRHYPAFLLELATGLRRGELLAVKWGNIDFNQRTLSIKEQLVRTTEGLTFKSLKTVKSRRTISLPPDIMDMLRMHKKKQAELKLMLGPVYEDNDLLFCAEDGKPLDPKSFVDHFKRLLKKAGLNIRFHDLRHTFATLSLEAGIPVKTVQEMLGHTTSKMVMDVYGHVTKDMHEAAAATIGGILAECIKK